MLTCDICGEAIMFEEDMRTHLLLSHLENDMHCPLCSLSGVSYDELCFHISSAHPDKQDQAHLTVTTDSVPHKWNMTAESGGSSPGETLPTTSTLITQGSKTRLKSFLLLYDCLCICCLGSIYYASLFISNCNVTIDLNCPSHFTEELFSCPMCALVCSSSFILQEHVELHLQEEVDTGCVHTSGDISFSQQSISQ
uniref:C2H2-type domain-containing protein n=1 Tax=Sparus aurata TaxID=8175 RepID=A0A671U0Z9_SPAAU